ncbi:MAG: 3-dehydroquinate synthase [Planctomycetota bacterium]
MKQTPDYAIDKVRVNLESRSYDILIGQGLLPNLPSLFPNVARSTSLFVVCDEHVQEDAALVAKGFKNQNINATIVVLPSGENQKCLDSASKLFDQLVNIHADRKTMVLAMGGGVVGDLAGFVAATFNRGLNLFMVPTTLLSMVDSSVGGKTGINHPKGKNLIGAFHQPAGVAIDIDVLRSLPDREYRSGLAEIVKYGMIMDADFFAFLEANAEGILERKPELLIKIIKRSCECKAQVVSQDEREETGLRASLNFGHTFAHAFETIGGYGSWLHGEAVAAGMVCANKVSLKRGLIDADTANRMVALLKAFKLPTEPPELSSAALLEVMRNDKKSVRGSLRFILATKLGAVSLFDDVTEENVKGVLSPLI